MENKKEVLIIIPAYNEEKNIVSLLEKLEQPEIAQIADVLIMNDASSDATNYVVKKRNHEVVTHVFNLGYGSGLQLGYKYAVRKDYRYVIQMDADGQRMKMAICRILFLVHDSWKEAPTFRFLLRKRLLLDGFASYLKQEQEKRFRIQLPDCRG